MSETTIHRFVDFLISLAERNLWSTVSSRLEMSTFVSSNHKFMIPEIVITASYSRDKSISIMNNFCKNRNLGFPLAASDSRPVAATTR